MEQAQSGQFDHKPTVYRDFANIAEQDWTKAPAMKSDNFPAKLHYVLSDMKKEGLQHIAAWQTHGRCFLVHDRKLFTQLILPFWFHQSKFDSFQRQLNLYGLVRIASGPDKGGYYHELFLRGKIFLTTGIHRKKTIRHVRAARPQASDAQPQAYEHNLDLYQFPSLPSCKTGSLKQHAENFISSPSSPISKQDDTPLTCQTVGNFKPSLSMKVRDIYSNKVSTPTRKVERSSMLPLLNAFAMRTATTTSWPRSPQVTSTQPFSLLDIVLLQQLMSNGSRTSCASDINF